MLRQVFQNRRASDNIQQISPADVGYMTDAEIETFLDAIDIIRKHI
jgi:hypothetical protein